MAKKPNAAPQIERGIECPPARTAGYPFRSMEVGDSILLEGNLDCIQTYAYRWAKVTGWRFVSRKQDATHVRVWRVAPGEAAPARKGKGDQPKPKRGPYKPRKGKGEAAPEQLPAAA